MREANVADTDLVGAGYDPEEVMALGPPNNIDNGSLGGGGGKKIPYPLKDYAALIAALSDVTADESVSFHGG